MRKVLLGAVTATTLALTGCAAGPGRSDFFERVTVTGAAAALGDAEMAFFVGPQNDEMFTPLGEVHQPGYLVLVGPTGTFRAIRTERMDMLRPAWSEHGLYAADESYDYRVTDAGVVATASPKATAQNQMFALPDGGAVGVFNGGSADDGAGYVNQVTGPARRYDVQGNYFTGARCGSVIYGIAEDPGTHVSAAPPGMTAPGAPIENPQVLTRLYPDERVVGWRPNFGTGSTTGPVPCHDDKIIFLSWDTGPAGHRQPVVVTWDTTTGESRARPLTFGDDTVLDDEDLGYVVQDFRDGRLHWVYADGRVFATDPATGRTTTSFATGLGTGPNHPTTTLFTFTAGRLHALSRTPSGDGGLTYRVFDRADGTVLSVVSVPIPGDEVDVSYRNVTHMAARPDR